MTCFATKWKNCQSHSFEFVKFCVVSDVFVSQNGGGDYFQCVSRCEIDAFLCFHEFPHAEQQIADIFDNFPHVRGIDFRTVDIAQQYLPLLFRIVFQYPIQVLILDDVNLFSEIASVCDYVTACKSLTFLHIKDCGIQAREKWMAIANMLRNNHSVKDLDVRTNNVLWNDQFDVADALVAALCFNKYLQSLGLPSTISITHTYSFENIDPTHRAKHLSDNELRLLRHNVSLQNVRHDDGRMVFSALLERNASYSDENLRRLVVECFTPLTVFDLPVYVLLHIFNWLCVVQPNRKQLYAYLETVENHKSAFKLDLIAKLLQSTRRIKT